MSKLLVQHVFFWVLFLEVNWTEVNELTCVVGGTKTCVVVDSINAGRSVLTVMVFTVVNIDLASRALEAH